MSEPIPAPPAPWTIGEPQSLLRAAIPRDGFTVQITAGELSDLEVIARIYGPSPEVCLDRARRFVAAMRGWQPIESHVDDGGPKLYGLFVTYEQTGARAFHAYLLWRDESGAMREIGWGDYFTDWQFEDFSHWAEIPQPLPSPPLDSQEERQ